MKEDFRGLMLLGGGGVVGWRVMGVSRSEGRELWEGSTRPGMMCFVVWVIASEEDWGCGMVGVKELITRPLPGR